MAADVSASIRLTEAVFDFIDKSIGSDKIVLVIDELSYWAERDEALLSIMQKYIDTVWNDKNLKIILCGSALSFMEKRFSVKRALFLEEEIPRSGWRHFIIWIQLNLFRTIHVKIKLSAMALPVVLPDICQ